MKRALLVAVLVAFLTGGYSFAQTEFQPSVSSTAKIADEGTTVTRRDVLNFTGVEITCTDDAGNERTNCALDTGLATGTSGTIPKFGSSNTLVDSIVTESGTTATVAGSVNTTGGVDVQGAAGITLSNDETITNAVDGTVKVLGILSVRDSSDLNATGGGVVHVGSSDTDYLALDPNEIQAMTGGAAGELHINTHGGGTNVHSVTDGVFSVNTSDLYVEALGDIGAGTTDPDGKFHIWAGSSGGSPSGDFIVEDDAYVNLTLSSPSDKTGRIDFGDVLSNNAGRIEYHHSADRMDFDAGATHTLSITSAGIGVNTTTVTDPVTVNGNVEATGFTINGTPVGTSTDTYWSVDGGGDITYTGGKVEIDDTLVKSGDSNTYLFLGTDDLRLYAGGLRVFRGLEDDTQDTIELGVAGQDADLKVNSALSSPAALFVEGSTSNVGIRQENPQADLHIYDSVSAGVRLESGAGGAETAAIYNDGSLHVRANVAQTSGGTTYYDADSHVWKKDDNTTQHMILDANGRLGIGTNSPARKLDAHGAIRSGDDSYAGFLAGTRTGSGDDVWMYNSGGDMRLYAGQNDRLTIDSTGQLGVGTTDPLFAIDAYIYGGDNTVFDATDSSTWRGQRMKNSSTTAGSSAAYMLRSNSFDAGIFAITDGTSNNGRVAFVTDPNPTEVLTLKGGNVGISQADPEFKLHVSGGDIQIEDTGASSSPQLKLKTRVPATDTTASADVLVTSADTVNEPLTWVTRVKRHDTSGSIGATYNLQDRTSGTAVSRLHITQSGNVGLGSETATSNLTVQENTDDESASLELRGTATAAGTEFARVELKDVVSGGTGSNPGEIRMIGTRGNDKDAADLDFQFSDSTGSLRSVLFIDGDDAKVGINTTSPTENLTVAGEDPGIWIQHDTANEDASGHLDFTENTGAFGSGNGYGWRILNDGDTPSNTGTLRFQSGYLTTVTDRLVIQRDTGNIGVGVVAPESQFEIGKTGADTVGPDLTLRNTAASINGYTDYILGEINFAGNDRAAGETGIGAKIVGHAETAWNGTADDNPAFLAFYTNPNGAGALSERMRIDSLGQLAIGTTTAEGAVEVDSDDNDSLVLRRTTEAAGNSSRVRFQTGTGALVSANSIGYIEAEITAADPNPLKGELNFYTNAGDNSNLAMTISDSQNLGVGVALPLHKVHTDGAFLSTDVSYSSNQDAPYMIAGTTSFSGATTDWGTYGFQHRLKANAGGTPRITVDTNGGEIWSMNSIVNLHQNLTTDDTMKKSRKGVQHYDNEEEPFIWAVAASGSSANEIVIGGGTTYGNAATSIAVMAAANNTTTNGTRIAQFTTNGLGIHKTSPFHELEVVGKAAIIGASATANTELYLARSVDDVIDNDSGAIRIARSGATNNIVSGSLLDDLVVSNPAGGILFGTSSTDGSGNDGWGYGSAVMKLTEDQTVAVGRTDAVSTDEVGAAETKLHVQAGGTSNGNVEVARFQGGQDADLTYGVVRVGASNDRALFIKGGRDDTGGAGGTVGYIGTVGFDGVMDAPMLTFKATGNVFGIRGVDYVWPSAVATAGSRLTSDTSGNLSWTPTFRGALLDMSANQSVSAGTDTLVDVDNEVDDVGGWSSSAGMFTVPSGVSRVRVSFSVKANDDETGMWRAQINKNGAIGYPGAAKDWKSTVEADQPLHATTPVIAVSAGDYFKLKVYCANDCAIDDSGMTWFAIEAVE